MKKIFNFIDVAGSVDTSAYFNKALYFKEVCIDILLSRRGFTVTHNSISPASLLEATENYNKIHTIEFNNGDATTAVRLFTLIDEVIECRDVITAHDMKRFICDAIRGLLSQGFIITYEDEPVPTLSVQDFNVNILR